MKNTPTSFPTHHPHLSAPHSPAAQTAPHPVQQVPSATTAHPVPHPALVNVTVSHAVVIVSSSTVVVHAVVTVTTLIPAAPHPRTNTLDIKVPAATVSLSADERQMNNPNLKEEASENNTQRRSSRPFVMATSCFEKTTNHCRQAGLWRVTCSRIRGLPRFHDSIMDFVIFVLDKLFVS